MSALTELRKRITTPDGHLVDRNKIDVELGKAIAAEMGAPPPAGTEMYVPAECPACRSEIKVRMFFDGTWGLAKPASDSHDELMFRINKQRDCIKDLRAHLDSEGKIAGAALFKCGVYEIMLRRLREWEGMYLSDGMARREFKAILKECEETRP